MARDIIRDSSCPGGFGWRKTGLSTDQIVLRGVRVHNLKGIDLDLPRRQLIVVCGVSGSGKTSLALDAMYAEGQRRYIESFSTYTRQFLDQFDKPDADQIDGIPPAIAVVRQVKSATLSSRTTVGTATEITEYLRLLYSKIGHLVCYGCGQPVTRDDPESAARSIEGSFRQGRMMVTFPLAVGSQEDMASACQSLQEDGLIRVIHGGEAIDLSHGRAPTFAAESGNDTELQVIVDRLTAETTTGLRLTESLELAFEKGLGRCGVLLDSNDTASDGILTIAGRAWSLRTFSDKLRCTQCNVDYPDPEPRLYSYNSPLGACPSCEGFGHVQTVDMELVVPDVSETLRDGAVAPWKIPVYAHELKELLELATDYDLPVDIPFRELTPDHLAIIRHGVPEREFEGLDGFFAGLQQHKSKPGVRAFLSRWQSHLPCKSCQGTRLSPAALATQLDGSTIAELCGQKVRDLSMWLMELELDSGEQAIARIPLEQIASRLKFLNAVGLGYLTLDRTIRTLSGGEAQRVSLTSALGSNLVNMLYVLDEPSSGLHPTDVNSLCDEVKRLRDRGNTVVVVEHEETFLRAADHIVEFGPAAGDAGGEVVFEGSIDEIVTNDESLTGAYLAGRRGASIPSRRRQPDQGYVRVIGARGNNLRDITVDFPLGLLCLVTGVSGAGKSTLVQGTLYPALARQLQKDAPKPAVAKDVVGAGQFDDVLLVDQSPIARSSRSNPVTYIKAFDEIRAVFADTIDARTHNYTASFFSFNVDGGRCEACKGDGFVRIDMQFMADVFVKCSECGGRRYRREILEVTYRGRNIAEVLDMTAREAFAFFRGQTKVQNRLKRLLDVGLEYLRLGQPANTLSSGEAQRLKLASYLGSTSRSRTLILLDEPTTGLHFADVVNLLDCFDALISIGHSLVIVEHNVQLMKAADYIIDMGPGAADEGGRVIATGSPEEVAQVAASPTGRCLARALKSGDGARS